MKLNKIFSFRYVAARFMVLANDYPAVQRQAEAFELILDGRDDYSTQIQVPGADHYFGDFENELVEVITNWLDGLIMPDRQDCFCLYGCRYIA